jgi:hypothetical protein
VAQPAGDPRRRPTQPELLLDVAAQELVLERVACAMPQRSLARLLMSRVGVVHEGGFAAGYRPACGGGGGVG